MKRFSDLLKIAAMSLMAVLFVGSCVHPEPDNSETGKDKDEDAPFIFTDAYDAVSDDITSITTSFSPGDETNINKVVSRLKNEGIVSESTLHKDYLELEFSDGSHMIYPFIAESIFDSNGYLDDIPDDVKTKVDLTDDHVPATYEVFCAYDYVSDPKRSAQYHMMLSLYHKLNNDAPLQGVAHFHHGESFTSQRLVDALRHTRNSMVFVSGHGFGNCVVTGKLFAKINDRYNDPICDIGTKIGNTKYFNEYCNLAVVFMDNTVVTDHGQLVYLGGCDVMSSELKGLLEEKNICVLGWQGKNTLAEAAAYILADRLVDGASVNDFLEAWHENDGVYDEVKDLRKVGKVEDFQLTTKTTHYWDRQSKTQTRTGFTKPEKKIKLLHSVASNSIFYYNFYRDKDEIGDDYKKFRLYVKNSNRNDPDIYQPFNYMGNNAWEIIYYGLSGVLELKSVIYNVEAGKITTQYSVRYGIISDSFKENGVELPDDIPDVVTYDVDEETDVVSLKGKSYGIENVRESGFRYYPRSSPSDVTTIRATGDPVFSAKPSGLESGNTYCAYAYVVDAQGNTHDGNVIEFIAKQDNTIPANPEYVDLGLSVKWATCNLGATKPEEYGLYYQWGDTQGYGSDTSDGKYFDWSDGNGNVTYKWCNGSYNSLTKYNPNSFYGTVDNKTVLDMEDDAARTALGGNWRMPTDAEWTELRENCTWTWTKDYNGTGVAGRIVTSNKSGYTDRSIFLPAAGCRGYDGLRDAGSEGLYWSSSLDTGYPICAWYVDFYSDDVYWHRVYRFYGHSVRPVYTETEATPSISVTPTDLDFGTVKVGSSATVSFTITNTGSTAASVSISAPSAPVTSNVSGTITLNSTEMKTVTLTYSPKEKGSVGGRISVVSGGNTTNVRYSGNAEDNTGSYSYEYVDLGLSVKWATCNLGATKPEESGDFFAWGEVEPSENGGWNTYKWCDGSETTLTKYNWRSDYGPVVDNKLVLDLEDDAAHVLLKGNGRMPTWPEWHELIENCTWTQVEINGVPGLLAQSRVTGFTDKSVFFPKNVGGTGFFWTSSMIYDTTSRTNPKMAIAGIVTEYWAGNSWYDRCSHRNIRPVYE